MVSTYFHGFLVNSFAGDDPLVCLDHVPMSDDALTTAIRAVLAASPFHSEGHRKGCPRIRGRYTIEGFWSIFKRGGVGTFHKMSRKYMPLYVAEFQFRYNNRENADIFGTVISGC